MSTSCAAIVKPADMRGDGNPPKAPDALTVPAELDPESPTAGGSPQHH